MLVDCQLPLQMKKLVVADVTVTIRVALQLSEQLMVLADSPSQPWSLVGLNMPVEDRETGQGKAYSYSL